MELKYRQQMPGVNPVAIERVIEEDGDDAGDFDAEGRAVDRQSRDNNNATAGRETVASNSIRNNREVGEEGVGDVNSGGISTSNKQYAAGTSWVFDVEELASASASAVEGGAAGNNQQDSYHNSSGHGSGISSVRVSVRLSGAVTSTSARSSSGSGTGSGTGSGSGVVHVDSLLAGDNYSGSNSGDGTNEEGHHIGGIQTLRVSSSSGGTYEQHSIVSSHIAELNGRVPLTASAATAPSSSSSSSSYFQQVNDLDAFLEDFETDTATMTNKQQQQQQPHQQQQQQQAESSASSAENAGAKSAIAAIATAATTATATAISTDAIANLAAPSEFTIDSEQEQEQVPNSYLNKYTDLNVSEDVAVADESKLLTYVRTPTAVLSAEAKSFEEIEAEVGKRGASTEYSSRSIIDEITSLLNEGAAPFPSQQQQTPTLLPSPPSAPTTSAAEEAISDISIDTDNIYQTKAVTTAKMTIVSNDEAKGDSDDRRYGHHNFS
jgi:hypothetical protein